MEKVFVGCTDKNSCSVSSGSLGWVLCFAGLLSSSGGCANALWKIANILN
ncbi:hypothetical protein Hanom_Chr08g00737671 [Helianthus anomalus]